MNPFRSAVRLRQVIALAVGSASLIVGGPASAALAVTSHGGVASPVTAVAPGIAPGVAQADEITANLHLSGSPVAPGGIMTVTASVTNRTAETIPAGRLVLSSGSSRIDATNAFDAWMGTNPGAGDDGAAEADQLVADIRTGHEITAVDVDEISPGASFSTESILVPADSLELPADYGVYPIRASYSAGAATAESRDTFIFTPTAAPATVGVAVAVPLTVPASADGLIPADLLETYTGPSGVLTRQLDGVRDRPVAIGIDPRIIASIRALGTAAPESATSWLERLQSATNETFALQYADADPAAQSQMGFDALLQPTSLLYGMNPANFAGMTPPPAVPTEPSTAGTDGAHSVPGATPTATTQPDGSPALPDLAQLLDWPYTDDGILWPADDSAAASDLPVFQASGATQTILSSTNTQLDAAATASASARVGDASVLVSDAPASAEFRAATVTAVTPDQQQDALNALSSRLAVLSSNAASDGTVVLLTLDRGVPPTSFRVGEAIGSLQSLAGTRVATLDDARSRPSVETAIVDAAEPSDRLSDLADRWKNESRLGEFATVLDQPELLTGRERAELLALTAIGWQETPDTFDAAVDKHREQTSRTLQSVQLATTSQITMISGQASLPFAVRNDLGYPITVRLDASASNPRLDIDGSVTKKVPANSRETVSVPVEARLGNGDVTVRLQLFSATGVRVASDAFVPVVVRADWEGIGAIILGTFVLLLFVGGLVRTILKRRAERRADETAAAPETAATPETPEATEATEATGKPDGND
ncbi:hypothetical protein SAMN06309945_0028 [Okibacterium fritillariae]|uniref:Uncharacterized protein n=1 Tax=Okibacterium fritillariae TaxID=123320 RepID=A0A1T5I7I8_9MICO|nr:hypothetical protein SAMN06309945_0028 [Okibacterium fritillariae]